MAGRATELLAFVVGEGRLEGGHLVGRNASQALLVSADGGHLGNHRAQPPVGGAQDDRVAAGIAAAPQADPVRVYEGEALQEGDGPAPVGDLHPRVDVVARRAVAGPEAAVVVHQHNETRVSEHSGESLQPVVLHPRKAVRHGDGRVWAWAVRHKQPTPQHHIALGGELDVLSLHDPLLPEAVKRHNIHDVRTSSEEGRPP